jgi:thioredoxin reductase
VPQAAATLAQRRQQATQWATNCHGWPPFSQAKAAELSETCQKQIRNFEATTERRRRRQQNSSAMHFSHSDDD